MQRNPSLATFPIAFANDVDERTFASRPRSSQSGYSASGPSLAFLRHVADHHAMSHLAVIATIPCPTMERPVCPRTGFL